jgi:hypothetical protein
VIIGVLIIALSVFAMVAIWMHQRLLVFISAIILIVVSVTSLIISIWLDNLLSYYITEFDLYIWWANSFKRYYRHCSEARKESCEWQRVYSWHLRADSSSLLASDGYWREVCAHSVPQAEHRVPERSNPSLSIPIKQLAKKKKSKKKSRIYWWRTKITSHRLAFYHQRFYFISIFN